MTSSPPLPKRKSTYYISFNMNITGDYNIKNENFLPEMVLPDMTLPERNVFEGKINKYKIYFLPTIPLSNKLLEQANLFGDPRKIFISITSFQQLVRFVTENGKSKLSLIEAKKRGITEQNIEYIKNLYFKRDNDFYINGYVYKINKANITNLDKALNPPYDNKYKINIDVSLLDAKRNLKKVDYFKLDCNDRAKILDKQALELFNVNLNLFKEIAPVPKRISPVMYTGDRGSLDNKQNPQIQRNYLSGQPFARSQDREFERILAQNREFERILAQERAREMRLSKVQGPPPKKRRLEGGRKSKKKYRKIKKKTRRHN